MFLGFVIGRWSYMEEYENRLMNVPGSILGQAFRQRRLNIPFAEEEQDSAPASMNVPGRAAMIRRDAAPAPAEPALPPVERPAGSDMYSSSSSKGEMPPLHDTAPGATPPRRGPAPVPGSGLRNQYGDLIET